MGFRCKLFYRKNNDPRPNRQSTETGKGVDGGAWEGMMAGRKLINGVSDENNETIDSSISDNVDFYSDR